MAGVHAALEARAKKQGELETIQIELKAQLIFHDLHRKFFLQRLGNENLEYYYIGPGHYSLSPEMQRLLGKPDYSYSYRPRLKEIAKSWGFEIQDDTYFRRCME